VAFDFIGFDAGLGSQIRLDNASVNVQGQVIPAPPAALLALIGLGTLGIVRRKRRHPQIYADERRLQVEQHQHLSS
jgi:MYXO-CTERM domain-containing protein